MDIIELGEEGGRQGYKPVDPLTPLQRFEDDAAGSVVDVTMRDGQPLADPATGVVKQQGEGALLPVVRFGQRPVDGGEEAPPLVGGQVLAVAVLVEELLVGGGHGGRNALCV